LRARAFFSFGARAIFFGCELGWQKFGISQCQSFVGPTTTIFFREKKFQFREIVNAVNQTH
jgi:hypothetical protein